MSLVCLPLLYPLLPSSHFSSPVFLSVLHSCLYTSVLRVCPNPNCLYPSVTLTLDLIPTHSIYQHLYPNSFILLIICPRLSKFPITLSPSHLGPPRFSFSCSQPLISLYPPVSHLQHTLCRSIHPSVCLPIPSVCLNCAQLSISLDWLVAIYQMRFLYSELSRYCYKRRFLNYWAIPS